MCRNHKNDHLLCGILCTRCLIIDGIKALLDSWRHSERNWNSFNPGLLIIVCIAGIWLYVLQTIEAWISVRPSRKGEEFWIWLVSKKNFVNGKLKADITENIIFLRNVNLPIKARIKVKRPLRDVLWSLSKKSVWGGGCTCTPAGSGPFSSASSSLSNRTPPQLCLILDHFWHNIPY